MKKIIALFIVVVIIFSACEKNVTINVPEKAPRLVVDAWLEKNQNIALTVGKSRHILQPAHNFPDDYLVTNAQVVIFENGVSIDTLVYQPTNRTYYTVHDKKIREGFTYSVKVTAPGFPDITAATIVPSQSVIAEVSRQRNVRVNSYGEQVDDIFIKLSDPAGEKNFYLIQIYGGAYGTGAQGYTVGCVSTTDKDVEAIGDDTDPTETDNCYDGGSLLMRDMNFDGRTKQAKFSVVSDQLMEYTYNGRTYRPYVKVHRITEDYFKFIKSLSIFSNADDNPFAEPVNVFTNVQKGYGIFSAYTSAVDTLR